MAFDRDYIAGAYSVTWGATPKTLGYTEAGFELVFDFGDIVPVVEDRHGEAIVDGIFTGLRSMHVRIESLYFNAEVWAGAFPFLGQTTGLIGQTAGELMVQSALAEQMVLTPKTGSAAVVAGGGLIWTLPFTWPVEPVTLSFAARRLRRVPMVFQVFPTLESDDSKEAVWYTAAEVSA